MDMAITHEYFLNPDGSGKVIYHVDAGVPEGEEPETRRLLREEIDQAKGVEVWAGLDARLVDGRFQLDGTAYFRCLKDLRLHTLGMHTTMFDLSSEASPEGDRFAAGCRGDEKSFIPELPPGDDPAARLAALRVQFGQMKEFLADFIGGLVCSVVIHLPGRIEHAEGANVLAPEVFGVDFSGRTVVALLDRLMEDDDLCAEILKGEAAARAAVKDLLPGAGPYHAIAGGPLAPTFDYDAETAAAWEGWGPLLASLSLPPDAGTGGAGTPEAPEEMLPPLMDVRVAGVRWVRDSDPDNGLEPFSSGSPSLTLVVVGEFPVPVKSAEEAMVTAALTDNGESLKPEDEWRCRISFPKQSRDGAKVLLEVELAAPPAGATHLATVEGTVTCITGGPAEGLDLGFPSLTPGATGPGLSATLESLEDAGDGRQSMALQVHAPRGAIESVVVLDPDGAEIPVEINGYSSSGDVCTLWCALARACRPDGRVLARVVSDMRQQKMPFALGPVDFTGRPVEA